MNFSRSARSFLPVGVLGFHPKAGWRANFSDTAERMNLLRLASGMRLRSESGIFTVTACSVFVIPEMYYLSHQAQAFSCPRLESRSVSFCNSVLSSLSVKEPLEQRFGLCAALLGQADRFGLGLGSEIRPF
jgi:hypothetical protein